MLQRIDRLLLLRAERFAQKIQGATGITSFNLARIIFALFVGLSLWCGWISVDRGIWNWETWANLLVFPGLFAMYLPAIDDAKRIYRINPARGNCLAKKFVTVRAIFIVGIGVSLLAQLMPDAYYTFIFGNGHHLTLLQEGIDTILIVLIFLYLYVMASSPIPPANMPGATPSPAEPVSTAR